MKTIKKHVPILVVLLALYIVPTMSTPVRATSCTIGSSSTTVEGCIVDYDTGAAISGMDIWLVLCGLTDHTTTDASGHFSISLSCLLANWGYPLTVNGVTTVTQSTDCFPNSCHYLGNSADNPVYSQWAGDVLTDSNAHGSAGTIRISHAQVVGVIEAALYNNNRFTTLGFSTTQGQSVTQTLGVSASLDSGGSSFKAGYEQSITDSVSSTNGMTVQPGYADYLTHPSYAIAYYCAGTPQAPGGGYYFGFSCTSQSGSFQGINTAGVTEPTGDPYKVVSTTEPNPNPPSGATSCQYPVPQGASQIISSQTSGSATTTFSIDSTPVTLFGFSVTFSYSTSTSWTTDDATSVTVGSTDNFPVNLAFSPTPSGACDHLVFGSELHVWDSSSAPGFSISASPSTLNVAPGSTGTSTVTLTGFNGFNEPVSLSYNAPTGISATLLPTNPTVASAGATVTATISVGSAVPCGSTYPVTITATSSAVPTIVHSTTVSVAVLPNCDFTLSANPSSISVTQGSFSKTTTITVQPTNGFNGVVSLSATSVDQNLVFSFNPTSVNTITGTVTSVLTITDSVASDCGSPNFIVTGSSQQLTHAITIPLTISGAGGACGFSMSATPTSLSIASYNGGCLGSSTLTISSVNGFAGTINLSTTPSATGTGPVYAWTYNGPNYGASPVSSVTLSGTTTATVYIDVWATNQVTTAPITVTTTATSNAGTHYVSITATFTNPSGCANASGGSGGGGGGHPHPTSPGPTTGTARSGTKNQ